MISCFDASSLGALFRLSWFDCGCSLLFLVGGMFRLVWFVFVPGVALFKTKCTSCVPVAGCCLSLC